jgi:hypothetical protein
MARTCGFCRGRRHRVGGDSVKKIITIPWNQFFRIEEEKMTVFKLIPHSTLSNNQSYKLWRTLHGVYTKFSDRIYREGKTFRYRLKERVWFDITFRSKETGRDEQGNIILEKQIQFFLACPTHLAEHVKHHFQHHFKEKSAGITLEEVEMIEARIPTENTQVCDLKLSKHDMFSLDSDYTKQTTPISFLLNCIHDVRGNDVAKISICSEPYDRVKWNDSVENAHSRFKKGKVPKRFRTDARGGLTALLRALDKLYGTLESFMNEVIEIVDSIGSKEKRRNHYEKKHLKERESLERKKLMVDGRLSPSTEKKKHAPVFKTHIRIASHSEDPTRREMTKRSLVTAFDQLSENNSLIALPLGPKEQQESLKEINNFKLNLYSKSDLDANIFSNFELGKLTQLPTANVQREFEKELETRQQVEVEVPSIFRKKGLLIGHAEQKGENTPVYIPTDNPDELFKGYVFQGSMGKGKDTAVKNFVVEGCLHHGLGFIVPDAICEKGHRGMSDGIRDSLPPEKIIDLDLTSEFRIPMDLTEVITKLGKDGSNRFASEMIGFFGDLEHMARSRKYLREAAKASGGSLFLTKLIIEDEHFRKLRIQDLREEGRLRLADELERWGDNQDVGSKVDSLVSRLDEFFGDDNLHDIFGQPPIPELNFEQWMEEGKVILIRVPNRKLSEVAVKTLMHWITLKTFMTCQLMEKENRGAGSFIVFNEPHQYMTKGLEKLMTRIALEGRKEKLGSLFAFHHIGLLPDKLVENLQAGGVNWLLFGNDYKKVFDMMKTELEPNFTVEEALNIPSFHAINILNFGGKRQRSFLVKMLPPSTDRYEPYDNLFLTARHARMYGRHWKEVEKMTAGSA